MLKYLIAVCIIAAVSGPSQGTESQSKCYGDSSYIWNHFNLTCSTGVISIQSILAMVNPVVDNCPAEMHQHFPGNKTTCCQYQTGDCGAEYTDPQRYYDKCNGRQSCPGLQVSRMPTPTSCVDDHGTYPDFTQFMTIELDCVPGVAVGGNCTHTDECYGDIAECVNNLCKCPPEYSTIYDKCWKDCAPVDIRNADVVGNITFESSLIINCWSGFSINGTNVLTCDRNGKWNFDVPRCEKDCQDLIIQSADVIGDTTFGSTVTVDCWPGLTINGAETLTCGTGGVWSNHTPTCEKDCPALNIQNADITGGMMFGSTVTVDCWPGLTINGTETLTCGRGGVWSDEQPTCEEVSGPSQGTESQSKCYGDSSYIWNHFNLTCSTGVISIQSILAIVNPVVDNCPAEMHQQFPGNKTTCCLYQTGDCGADYTDAQRYYDKCNGRPSCPGLQVSRMPTPTSCVDDHGTYPDFTQFMIIEFDCVPDVAVGGNCTHTDECYGDIAGCVNNICKCPAEYSTVYDKCWKDCPALNIQGADVIGGMSFGSTASVTCWPGLTINGDDTLTCGPGGVWSDEPPTCEEDCPALNIQGADVIGGMAFGSTASVTCWPGLTVNGDDTLTCGPGGVWSDEPPTCEEECPALDIQSADVFEGASFGSALSVSCWPGLTINGADTLTCGPGGVWSDEPPTCEEDCQALNIQGADVIGGMAFGSTASVTCLPGLTINGAETLTCGSGGVWSDETPTCEEDCAPVAIRNADVVGNITFESSLRINCWSGFSLNGTHFLTCDRNGQWNFDVPRCEKDCKALHIQGADVIGDMAFGSTAYVDCWPGLTINGAATLTCGPGGVWSDEPPTCEEDCPVLNIQRSDLIGSISFGSTVNVACWPGLTINGTETLTCGTGGVWSDEPPTCEEGCEPITVASSNITGNTKFGSTVTVVCWHGFTINGTGRLVCGTDGRWSAEVPTCVEKDKDSGGSGGLNLIFIIIPIILMIPLGCCIIIGCCIYKKKRKARTVKPTTEDTVEMMEPATVAAENQTLDEINEEQHTTELKGVSLQPSRENVYEHALVPTSTALATGKSDTQDEAAIPTPVVNRKRLSSTDLLLDTTKEERDTISTNVAMNKVRQDQTDSTNPFLDNPKEEQDAETNHQTDKLASTNEDSHDNVATNVTSSSVVINLVSGTNGKSTTDRKKLKKRKRKRKFVDAVNSTTVNPLMIELQYKNPQTNASESVASKEEMENVVSKTTISNDSSETTAELGGKADTNTGAHVKQKDVVSEFHRPAFARENLPEITRPRSSTYYWRNSIM